MLLFYEDWVPADGLKYFYKDKEGGKEVARAYLYILYNDAHDKPFGFMEDVYVEESLRGQGIGSALVNKVIEEARRKGCYKIICTSRHTKPEVHNLYQKLGFKNHGLEFRIDL